MRTFLYPRRRRCAAVLACLCWPLLVLVLLAASRADAAEAVTLQLKWRHQFQFAGYYAALEKGYYDEAGLAVRIVEAGPDTDAIDEVVSGRAEYGVGSSALLLARAQGAPVVALAAIFQHSPLVLLARTDAGIGSVHDLAGKRLMLERQSEELIAYLKHEGVPTDSIVIEPHSLDPSVLLDRRADAASAYGTDEPFMLERAGIPHAAFSPRSAGLDFYGDNLFTSERELRAHPERVRAFRDASLRGWRYAMAHPEEIVELILARHGARHSREHLLYEASRMQPLLQPELVEMGYMYPGRWRHIADTYAGLGLLPRDFALDGFLYAPQADALPPYLLRAMAGVVVIGGAFGLVALVVLRLNRRLKREIVAREAATSELRESEQTLRDINARLQAQVEETGALQVKIREQAVRDPLTGLHNRRYLDENFERELARALREGYPLSLAAIDIDRFKRVNDTYGHPAGDQVLLALAGLLRRETRASDIVCRFGGEEFLLLMPNMAPEDARRRIDEWRRSFECLVVDHGGAHIRASFSAGIAACPAHAHTPQALAEAADRALYDSKRRGRNRVSVFTETLPPPTDVPLPALPGVVQ